MTDQYLSIRLFAYETLGGRASHLFQAPMMFWPTGGQGGKELDEGFAEWRRNRRGFTTDQLSGMQICKAGDHGHSFLCDLHPDGTLTERGLFDLEPTWSGRWAVTKQATLLITVRQYELEVVARREGRVHSGLEGNAYFSVIAVPTGRQGPVLREGTTWAKIGSNGRHLAFSAGPNGDLVEWDLENPAERWPGRWTASANDAIIDANGYSLQATVIEGSADFGYQGTERGPGGSKADFRLIRLSP